MKLIIATVDDLLLTGKLVKTLECGLYLCEQFKFRTQLVNSIWVHNDSEQRINLDDKTGTPIAYGAFLEPYEYESLNISLIDLEPKHSGQIADYYGVSE